eukprot:Nitzschia sp. Nitz4//scaffold304_size22322//19029//21871//NITZ4_008574-RA/size22322-snap-gene-0.3-mRNA-1//-1//CDS//3329547079//6329//frame0
MSHRHIISFASLLVVWTIHILFLSYPVVANIDERVGHNVTKLDCGMRMLALDFARSLLPKEDTETMGFVHDALRLGDLCMESFRQNGCSISTSKPSELNWTRSCSHCIHVVVPETIDDVKSHLRTLKSFPYQPTGSKDNPFFSLHDAVDYVRDLRIRNVPDGVDILVDTIVLHPGIHSLQGKPLLLTEQDSHLTIVGTENVWLSGGIPLDNVEFIKTEKNNIHVANLSSLLVNYNMPPILSLFTTERRYVRARYPNGDPEVALWGYASPHRLETSLKSDLVLEWHLPPKGKSPEFTLIDFTDPSVLPPGVPAKNDSTQHGYNLYASGKGGVCSDIWGVEADSYWCSNASEGGWSEVDRECAISGQMQLPIGLTYNTSASQLFMLRYASLEGSILHAWHSQSWAMHMFEISHHSPRTGVVSFAKGGGKQGGRNWCRCDQCTYAGQWCGQHQSPSWKDTRLIGGSWMIENVLEQLDQPGEYYFDQNSHLLYVIPNATLDLVDFRVALADQIIEIRGGENISVSNIGFRDTAPTYHPKYSWSAPSGGDWSLHRGGAVFIENATNISISNCRFRRLDGNAIFLSRRTRNITIQGNKFEWLGENAVATWGDTDGYDATSEDFPMDTLLEGNVMRELGIFEKQSSALGQSKAAKTIIRGNVMFNMPRAAINFNDIVGGGDLVEKNLIFNTCRESGDHGPINSWDRQPFLTTVKDGQTPSFEPLPRLIDRNFIIANYGASQGVDNDDGSSWYQIQNNLFYSAEGFKMDYGGHDSVFEDNLVMAFPYDGSRCFNMGGFYPSHGDTFRNNQCMVGLGAKMGSGCGDPSCASPIPEPDASQETVGHLWAGCKDTPVELSGNQYYTPDGVANIDCGSSVVALEEMQQDFGLELGSSVAKLPDEDTMVEWARAKVEQFDKIPSAGDVAIGFTGTTSE